MIIGWTFRKLEHGDGESTAVSVWFNFGWFSWSIIFGVEAWLSNQCEDSEKTCVFYLRVEKEEFRMHACIYSYICRLCFWRVHVSPSVQNMPSPGLPRNVHTPHGFHTRPSAGHAWFPGITCWTPRWTWGVRWIHCLLVGTTPAQKTTILNTNDDWLMMTTV